MSKFEVGQKVIVRDINESRLGGVRHGTVSKVARKLLTVMVGPYGRPETFRIDTGRSNDAYGHGWIQSVEEYAEELAWTEARARLEGPGGPGQLQESAEPSVRAFGRDR